MDGFDRPGERTRLDCRPIGLEERFGGHAVDLDTPELEEVRSLDPGLHLLAEHLRNHLQMGVHRRPVRVDLDARHLGAFFVAVHVEGNNPGLARLELKFDHRERCLRLSHAGKRLVEANLDPVGRAHIAAAVADFVLTLAENPLAGYPERLPLRLIGDGITPRYQDNEAGQITLHSRESLAEVAAATGEPHLDELRFRTNIVVDGLSPWAEQSWIGKPIRIGDVAFDVVRPKVRCLATHANPVTGERDVPLLQTLKRAFAQAEPTFAVGMLTRGGGGEIRLGDEVAL